MTVRFNTVDADGLKVFYRSSGDPSTPVVLLLHGFPSASHMFRNLIPELADNYHVVAPDLPGFGNRIVPGAPCSRCEKVQGSRRYRCIHLRLQAREALSGRLAGAVPRARPRRILAR